MTFPAPQPTKTAAPPPPVSVPVPSGVHKTLEMARAAGSSVPVPPAPPTPRTSFPVPRGATAAETHRMASAVPGGEPTPAGDRVDLLASQFPHLEEGEHLVSKFERRGNAGQLAVHWHDHATPTVMSRAKAVQLMGQELLDRHLADLRPRAVPDVTPSDWEKLLVGSLQEVVGRNQALLDHYWRMLVAHTQKLTHRPKRSTLVGVTVDKGTSRITFQSISPHHAIAIAGDSPTETLSGCGDRTIRKAAPATFGGRRVARRLIRSRLALVDVAAWLGIIATVGNGQGDGPFGFLAGVARVKTPFTKWHRQFGTTCQLGFCPLHVDVSVDVANPGAFESAAATAFNAGGGVKWVALIEEREVAGGVFFRVRRVPGTAGTTATSTCWGGPS